MSLGDEIARMIEQAINGLLQSGIPGANVIGQLAGKVLPSASADSDVPYAATEHTHPLADLEQSSATDGQVVTWDDGTSMWIPADPSASGVADGDKGDITVSGSGTVWTIDNDAVSYAKLQNVSNNRLLGRSTAGAGDVEEIQLGTGLLLAGGVLDSLFVNPMTSLGGLIRGNTGGVPQRLAAGTEYDLLTMASGTPQWGPVQGTYSPTYTGATTAGSTTYSVQIGRYYRLGNLCWFSARVDWTAATGTGEAQVSLPFAAKNIASFSQALSVFVRSVTFGGSGVQAITVPGTSVAVVRSAVSNATEATSAVEAAGTIILTGIYEIN